MKTVGKRIRDKREELGLTQTQLAEKLGVTRQTIYKWENGMVKHIDRPYFSDMATLFGCSAKWLMNMEDTDVFLTYEAEGREPVKVRVKGDPIIGETSLRTKLYNAALKVRPENIETAIKVLESMS